MGLKSKNFPFHAQVWLDFGYPTCAWSILDFLSWVSTSSNTDPWSHSNLKKRWSEEGFVCTSEEQGNSHALKTPLLEFFALEWWDWEYELIPFHCENREFAEDGSDVNTIVPQAKYCDKSKDPKCYIGCEPSPKYTACQLNPDYVAPAPVAKPVVAN